MRKLLAMHQQDASCLDAMSESANKLLEDTQRGTFRALDSDEAPNIKKTMKILEGREYKEVV
jgi:hypothetical protein